LFTQKLLSHSAGPLQVSPRRRRGVGVGGIGWQNPSWPGTRQDMPGGHSA
jgi:hypothetical protein